MGGWGNLNAVVDFLNSSTYDRQAQPRTVRLHTLVGFSSDLKTTAYNLATSPPKIHQATKHPHEPSRSFGLTGMLFLVRPQHLPSSISVTTRLSGNNPSSHPPYYLVTFFRTWTLTQCTTGEEYLGG